MESLNFNSMFVLIESLITLRYEALFLLNFWQRKYLSKSLKHCVENNLNALLTLSAPQRKTLTNKKTAIIYSQQSLYEI